MEQLEIFFYVFLVCFVLYIIGRILEKNKQGQLAEIRQRNKLGNIKENIKGNDRSELTNTSSEVSVEAEKHTKNISLWKVLGVIGVIFAGALVSEIIKDVGRGASESHAENSSVDVEALLQKFAKQINNQLPLSIDDDTRLDLTVSVGRNLTYKYTLVNVSLDDFDGDSFINYVKPSLVEMQCSQDNMLALLKMGVKYHYLYFDKNGDYIVKAEVKSDDCDL